MVGNGASGVEVTESIIKNYATEKMIFRQFNPEPGHFAWGMTWLASNSMRHFFLEKTQDDTFQTRALLFEN